MIRFDPAPLTDLVQVLDSAADAIAQHLRQLDSEQSALRAAWSGGARSAYDDARASWLRSMENLNEALSAATRSANIAGQTLEEADRSVAAKWG